MGEEGRGLQEPSAFSQEGCQTDGRHTDTSGLELPIQVAVEDT